MSLRHKTTQKIGLATLMVHFTTTPFKICLPWTNLVSKLTPDLAAIGVNKKEVDSYQFRKICVVWFWDKKPIITSNNNT